MVFYQCFMHKKLGWLIQVWLPIAYGCKFVYLSCPWCGSFLAPDAWQI